MADKIVVSNVSKGLQTDIPAFSIDNDAFPYLQNFYVWRNRILRKRGTQLLGRLQRLITSTGSNPIGNLSGAGALGATSLISVFSLQSGAQIVPGSISFTDGTNTFTDSNGVLTGAPGGTGTINYATSIITITGGVAGQPLTGTFRYNPCLPVMGCEDFIPNNPLSSTNPINYPVPLDFDTTYSYQFDETLGRFYDVSFHKTTGNPLIWSGADYQQFWSTSYYTATWVTNGKPGFHFKAITGITNANPGVVTIVNHGLVTGDKIWINEVGGTTQVNGQTYTVTRINANTFSIGVDTTAYGAYTSGGIAQYLTSSISGQDGIRWYDGDPIASSNSQGWVNFAPPLDSSATPQYLVGAQALVVFKDRLLAFGPTTQASTGSSTYYQNRVIYSQNGTPFYNSVVPINSGTAPTTSNAWYFSPVGLGGFISAGIEDPILTIGFNEDVIIVGFPSRHARLIYTSNDYLPFLFYSINSEIGSDATFASITLDRGVLNLGPYGFSMTTQTATARIDLQIPDQVFGIEALNHGIQRVCSARDYRNDWAYFTYPVSSSIVPESESWSFPTQTLLYNYRNDTWAILSENFTTYGQYRKQSDYTWASNPYGTWEETEATWNDGANTARYPDAIGGNQQGFVLIKGKGTQEAQSQYISAVSYTSTVITITSPNHCLQISDYVNFSNMIGLSGLSTDNYRVVSIADANTFTVNNTTTITGTYLGGGTYSRHVIPYLQTKQFAPYWNNGRQVRLGTSRYLLDVTQEGQTTLQIFTSQDPNESQTAQGRGSSIIFSEILSTAIEPNNLQTQTQGQSQVWHRISSSVIGESVQFGLTLSDAQMVDPTISTSEIALYSIIADVYPGPVLV